MQHNSRALLVLLASLGTVSCAGRIDKVVKKRAVPQLALGRDLGLACAFGSLGISLSEILTEDRSEDALAVSWITAGLCEEIAGREAQLQSQLARRHAPMESRAALATDARIRADRHFANAAHRFQVGYQITQDNYGGADDCRLKNDGDQSIYMLGLLAGMLALVNDAAAGMAVGVPQNQILEIGRQSHCLDNDRWWGIPRALEVSGWLVIPGSGPTGVDASAELAAISAIADAQGQGIPRALWLFTAANGGDREAVRAILADWPDEATAPDNEYALIDEYARKLAQVEADLLWISERGHRAPDPPMPPPAPSTGEENDPFGGDPFGGDPFGAASPETDGDDADPSAQPAENGEDVSTDDASTE